MSNKKRCFRCKKIKPTNLFSKCRAKRDGLASWCKVCSAKYSRLNREKYRERQRIAARKYYKNNPDKQRAASSKWRKANPKKVCNYTKKWQKLNPNKCRDYNKNWKKLNPDKNRDKQARRRAAKLGVKSEKVQRSLIYERDKGICHICSQKTNPNNWHLDHVIPLSKGGKHNYKNVAVSHPQCNLQKAAS